MTTTVSINALELSAEEFLHISEFIEIHYGIQLPISKKKMVEARLQKRLRALNVESFREYFDLVFCEENSAEYGQMIDLITTNKTDFFREPAHFDFLTNHVLPELNKGTSSEVLKVWSAASSSGEEVYSILVTLEEFFIRHGKKNSYHILGTDLSSDVLKKAVKGVYDEERIDGIPLPIKKRYFQRSKDRENPKARIKQEFLRKVSFRRLNLLKSFQSIDQNFDVIFCRNVLIYFNREVQAMVVAKLTQHLRKGGYLFIGHSESLTNMHLPLSQVKPTIYKKIK